MTQKQLRKLESNVYDASNRLVSALGELAMAASNVLHYDVVADICNGNEIEFRRIDENGIPLSDDCIRIEDIISKL